MEHLAEKLTHYIIAKGAIHKEDFEIYKYGLQTGMEMSLCMAISCLIAIHLNAFFEFLFFMIVFFPLRAYFGGIHMKHFLSCLICSCAVSTSVLILVKKYVFTNQVSFIITMIILFAMYKLESAVMMNKQDVDSDEISFLKRQQKRILIVGGILALVLLLFRLFTLEMVLMYVTFVVFSSMILERIKKSS